MSGWGSYGQSKQSSNAGSGLVGVGLGEQGGTNVMQRGGILNETADRNANFVNGNGQTQYNTGTQSFTGNQLLPGGQYGLGSNADAAMAQLGKQMFGYQSANLSARGMNSPENQSAVVGSAITNALPQVLPQIQSWQQAQFMAPLQLGQYALSNANTAADYWNRALGAQSQSSGNSFNFAGGGGVGGGGGA